MASSFSGSERRSNPVACERDSAPGAVSLLALIGASEKLNAQYQQSFQVLAFGKWQRHRVIGGRTVALDDLRFHCGVERGAGDDRLEERGVHAARARERGE